MPRRSPPKYARHSSGQARVRVDGSVLYLGEFGSPESHARYAEIVSKWMQRHGPGADQLTIGDLSIAYFDFAVGHYRKNGQPTSEVYSVKDALRRLNRLSRTVRVSDLSPRHLKAYQQALVQDGLSRKTINSYVGRIRRMVRWAVSEELVGATILLGLQTVLPLQRGRTSARETDPVGPVPMARIEAIRPFVPEPIWGLIQFQLHTGARPGEALLLRACDLNTSGDVWEYRPASHKTEHHSRQRMILIGKRGQDTLRPFLMPELQAFVFHPRGSAGARPYRRDSYRLAIVRGCELAFDMPDELRDIRSALVKVSIAQRDAQRKRLQRLATEWRQTHCWSPHQLRHNFATQARRQFGIEAVRTVLGHSSAVTTEIYAERDLDAAREVISRIG